MSDASAQIELQNYDLIAHEGRVFESVLAATFSVIIAEFFQTIENEVHFIWKSKMSFAKILYMANRYIAPVNIGNALYTFYLSKGLSPTVCYNEYVALSATSFFHAVLCVRAYAVYGFSKPVLGALLAAFLIMIVAGAFFNGEFIAGNFVETFGTLGSNGCVINGEHNNFWNVWTVLIILLVVELLALSLLLARSWKNFRESPLNTSLLTIMAKDGIIYFACVLALSIGNLLVVVSSSPVYKLTFFMTQSAFQNVLCVRLLLHLRTVNDEAEPAISTISTLHFNANLNNIQTAASESVAASNPMHLKDLASLEIIQNVLIGYANL
ncbi:hypothetical protein SCHPADRAFT_940859 [Schizopora paradoxa]|uniref:DUF6533 domain-containing protein n=1 Tax=Schizopora paradoxa TaxID=27342 RepID=A0A0H2RLV2_9AGAM|nr:hypothetical protein SCHPADRAFT_940859 [Schizopora paradoxa]